MSLISDLIPVVDSARKIIGDIGFRIHSVKTVHIVWANGIGIGTPTKTEVVLMPIPKVLKYTTEQIVQSGGAITEADLKISKISKIYNLEQLTGGELPKGEEFFWCIDDNYYTVIGYEERPLGWNTHVRRTNRKPI
jgi:hypothetical protein